MGARLMESASEPYSPAQCFPPENAFPPQIGCLPARAKIETFPEGSFQFDAAWQSAVVVPVQVDSGEKVDHVAWFPERRGDWWLNRKIATHLGDRALRSAAFFKRPVRLLATPADWWANPTDTICILDWKTDLRAL